jgi:hypothetical protein
VQQVSQDSGNVTDFVKKCSGRCGLVLPLDNFWLNKGGRGGREARCKQCLSEDKAARKAADPEGHKAYHLAYNQAWRPTHRDQVRESDRRWKYSNYAAVLLSHAKRRAKKHGLQFSITLKDIVIPELCPYLQLRLKLDEGPLSDNSPSLERIIPFLGYVPGNVEVISYRANRIKSNGTVEEHEKIAARMRTLGCL